MSGSAREEKEEGRWEGGRWEGGREGGRKRGREEGRKEGRTEGECNSNKIYRDPHLAGGEN